MQRAPIFKTMYFRLGSWIALISATATLTASCALGVAQTSPNSTNAEDFGTFTGTLELHPTGDGVHMSVVKTYSYIDSERHTLTANPGFETDGASIPRALWTVVGSPFTGKYIGAAVIHDVGCDTHKYSWEVTHRMFYTAMRELGVSENYAKLLYWGVRIGGPRWDETVKGGGLGHGPRTVIVPLPSRAELTDEQVMRIQRYIENRAETKAGAVTLDQIDARTPLTGDLPLNAVPNN
jgi:hypothetical protein